MAKFGDDEIFIGLNMRVYFHGAVFPVVRQGRKWVKKTANRV
jgi:hypothetical protein